jgi:hypothetical protein
MSSFVAVAAACDQVPETQVIGLPLTRTVLEALDHSGASAPRTLSRQSSWACLTEDGFEDHGPRRLQSKSSIGSWSSDDSSTAMTGCPNPQWFWVNGSHQPAENTVVLQPVVFYQPQGMLVPVSRSLQHGMYMPASNGCEEQGSPPPHPCEFQQPQAYAPAACEAPGVSEIQKPIPDEQPQRRQGEAVRRQQHKQASREADEEECGCAQDARPSTKGGVGAQRNCNRRTPAQRKAIQRLVRKVMEEARSKTGPVVMPPALVAMMTPAQLDNVRGEAVRIQKSAHA